MRNPDNVPITDFFGSVRPVNILTDIKMQLVVSTKLDNNDSKISQSKKYRYVPPLVNFNTLIY